MGIEAAILGSAVVGAGASIMGSRSQSSAARQAGQIAQDTSADQIALYRQIFNQQRADYEPFRQFELQRANALGELFGFDPVGQPASAGAQPGQYTPGATQPGRPAPNAGASYVNAYGDLRNAFNALSPSQNRFIAEQGFDANRDGQISMNEFGNFHYNTHGRAEGRGGYINAFNNPQGYQLSPDQLAQITGGQAAPGGKMISTPIQDTTVTPSQNGMQVIGAGAMQPESGQVGNIPTVTAESQTQNGGLAPTLDPSIAGADRFNNSAFNAVFTNNFNRDRDNIDQNLANQGLAYSGARMNAIENSRANNFQNAFGNYINTLMGAPSAGAATQGIANAGANFANSAGNSIGNRGVGMMNSALNAGNAQAQGISGVGNAFNFALGSGAFGGKPGGGFF